MIKRTPFKKSAKFTQMSNAPVLQYPYCFEKKNTHIYFD